MGTALKKTCEMTGDPIPEENDVEDRDGEGGGGESAEIKGTMTNNQ